MSPMSWYCGSQHTARVLIVAEQSQMTAELWRRFAWLTSRLGAWRRAGRVLEDGHVSDFVAGAPTQRRWLRPAGGRPSSHRRQLFGTTAARACGRRWQSARSQRRVGASSAAMTASDSSAARARPGLAGFCTGTARRSYRRPRPHKAAMKPTRRVRSRSRLPGANRAAAPPRSRGLAVERAVRQRDLVRSPHAGTGTPTDPHNAARRRSRETQLSTLAINGVLPPPAYRTHPPRSIMTGAHHLRTLFNRICGNWVNEGGKSANERGSCLLLPLSGRALEYSRAVPSRTHACRRARRPSAASSSPSRR